MKGKQLFLRDPTLKTLKEYLELECTTVQEFVNNTKEDHRYFQGQLLYLKNILNLIIEATN